MQFYKFKDKEIEEGLYNICLEVDPKLILDVHVVF